MPEKPPPYTAVEKPSAQQVTRRYQPSPEAKALLKPGMTPVGYSKALMRNGRDEDNITFMSHALPPRQGIRWASNSMQQSGFQWSPNEQQALQSANSWATRPSRRRYTVMRSRMSSVSSTSPVGMIGQAGGYAWGMGPQFGYGGLSGYGPPVGMTGSRLHYRPRWQSRNPSDIRFDSALNRVFGENRDSNAPDPNSFRYRNDPERYWRDLQEYRDKIARDLHRGRGGVVTDDYGNVIGGRGHRMSYEQANTLADQIVNGQTNGEFSRRGYGTLDGDMNLGTGMGAGMPSMDYGPPAVGFGMGGMGYSPMMGGGFGMGGMGYNPMMAGGFGMGMGMGGMGYSPFMGSFGMMSPAASCAGLLATALIGTATLVMLSRQRSRSRTYRTMGISGIRHYNSRREVVSDTSMTAVTDELSGASAPPAPERDGLPTYQESEGISDTTPTPVPDKPPIPDNETITGNDFPPTYSEAILQPESRHTEPPPAYTATETPGMESTIHTGFEQPTSPGTISNPDEDLITLEPDHEEGEGSENNDEGTSGTL
ncbi:DUF6931 family protein [Endozoicomonadaceae bacterium StTr2]